MQMESEEEPDYYFKNYAPRPFTAISEQVSESVPSNATFKTSIVSFMPDSEKKGDSSNFSKASVKKIKFHLKNETTINRIIEAPIESGIKRSVSAELTIPPPLPLHTLPNTDLNKKSKKNKEVILKNVTFVCNSSEETAYLLAVRITNKMIAEDIYNYFGPIHYINIPEKDSFDSTCTACLGKSVMNTIKNKFDTFYQTNINFIIALWNTYLHEEFVHILDHQIKFYGRTVTMKEGRNLPRKAYSWLNPEEPDKDKPDIDQTKLILSPKTIKPKKPKQMFQTPKTTPRLEQIPVPETLPETQSSNSDEKLCCDCCYRSCCCCTYLISKIQLAFNECFITIRNFFSKKVKPTCDSEQTSSLNYIK